MSNTTFSDNLRKLRQEKKYTQEFVAERLGVSPQSVSRWECGNTLPDVLLLPEIAKLYCVTVDDLYRERAVGYENYARRLYTLFTYRKFNTEDFALAEAEFRKLIASGEAVPHDRFLLGTLYQYEMIRCRREAYTIYNELLADHDTDEKTLRKTRMQRVDFLADVGEAEAVINEELERVNSESCTAFDMACLVMAYLASQNSKAYEWYKRGVQRFPEDALLYYLGGETCANIMNDYAEALDCFNKAYSLDGEMTDALYSAAFFYEKAGHADKAKAAWLELEQKMKKLGLDIDAEYAGKRARAI